MRLLGRHMAARDDHVERRLRPDQPRQSLGPGAAREDADQHLRQPDLGARHGDAIVGGERQFEPAAQRIAVDCRDHRFLAGVEDLMRAATVDRRRPVGAEGADVGAGDKAAAGADQHHRADRRVGIAALDALDDALGHARRQRVDRRVVDRDDPDPVNILKAYQGVFGHVMSLP